jgi:hypothetical protein
MFCEVRQEYRSIHIMTVPNDGSDESSTNPLDGVRIYFSIYKYVNTTSCVTPVSLLAGHSNFQFYTSRLHRTSSSLPGQLSVLQWLSSGRHYGHFEDSRTRLNLMPIMA